jgi:glycosyltransferase involved in cell wall biosynthesis
MSPHLLPLLNAVHDHPAMDLNVWYCAESVDFRQWSHDLTPNHRYTASRRRPAKWVHPEFHFDPAVIHFLKGNRADLTIISEGDIPTLRLAMWHLNKKRSPWVLRGERPILGDKTLGRIMLGFLVRHTPLKTAKAIIANGSLNASFYRNLLPWGKPVYSLPYYLDPERYSFKREQGIGRLCRLTGSSFENGEFLFLFVGQLIPRKGVLFLVDVFNQVAQNTSKVSLCVIGDGTLKEAMRGRLAGKAKEKVYFLGNLNFQETAELYSAGHAFVFPTQHDGWGMAINEAMAAGLPILSTNACGAACDLVQEGKNGYVLSPHDKDGFVRHMIFLATHLDITEDMGRASKRIIAMHTPRQGADRLYQICSQLMESIV